MPKQRNAKGQFASKAATAATLPARMSAARLPAFRPDHQVGTYTALGYQSKRVASRAGRPAIGGSGEFHAQYDRGDLINQSRQFYRDNAIYRGIIDRATSAIVGSGFKLQVQSGSTRWDDAAEAIWKRAHRRPEVKGLVSGAEMEAMVCREVLLAGDTLLVKLGKGAPADAKGKLQHIEAEQLAGPGHGGPGIKANRYGAPTEFYVASYRRGQVDVARAKPHAPEDVLYLAQTERPSSLRGVPLAQASFPMLHRVNDVCDSEAIAWQLLARMALSVTSEFAPEEAHTTSKADPDAGDDELADRMHEMAYALIFHARPGEEVKGIDRNIPGANFTESIRMFLRLLGLPLGLPLEMVLLDWTESNYSQSRAVMEQAYQTFLRHQERQSQWYLTPAALWQLERAMAASKLPDRDLDTVTLSWIAPTFPWIDQVKEAQAWGLKVDRGFATHAEVCKSLNRDRDEVVATRVREIEEALKLSARLEKKHPGQKVPWQILAGMKPPGEKKDGGRPAGDSPAGGEDGGQPDGEGADG